MKQLVTFAGNRVGRNKAKSANDASSMNERFLGINVFLWMNVDYKWMLFMNEKMNEWMNEWMNEYMNG